MAIWELSFLEAVSYKKYMYFTLPDCLTSHMILHLSRIRHIIVHVHKVLFGKSSGYVLKVTLLHSTFHYSTHDYFLRLIPYVILYIITSLLTYFILFNTKVSGYKMHFVTTFYLSFFIDSNRQILLIDNLIENKFVERVVRR